MKLKAYFFLILYASILLFVQSCTKTDETSISVFRYNESKGISTLDPAYARSQTLIWPVHQLFDGLVQFNEKLSIEPAIAKNWTVSDNGLLYTFTLRNDVLFHSHPLWTSDSERRVRAHDFVYSFNRIMNPKTSSPGAWIFSKLDKEFGENGCKALNDSTLQLKLSTPFPPFTGMLGMKYCVVVPQKLVDHYGSDFGINPVGTGPFVLKKWRHGEKIILHKNDDYYENAGQIKQVPQTDAIAISFITDKQSEFMEFMLEKIDFISGINPQFKDALLTRTGELREKHKSKIYLQKSPYLNTEYLGFNLDSTKGKVVPPAVRKAINYCFDREEMVMYMRNNMADPAGKGIVPPSLNQTYSHQLSGYSFDRDYARQLLAEHGFAGGYPSTIDLYTTSDYVDICEYIQHSAAQVGIDIKIHLATGASFRNMIANGEAQMFRASWIADYPDAENYLSLFYSPNKSPQGPNYTRFSHTVYDSLYKKALNETNHEKQAAIYRQMESIIIANAPIVPLYYDNVVRFVNNRIKNFPTNPLNLLEVKNVEIRDN